MKRKGDCYRKAAMYVIEHHDAILVHGAVPFWPDGPEPRAMFDHAWAVDGDVVHHHRAGEWCHEDRAAFERTAQEHARYTIEELRVLLPRFDHWGPWEEVAS